jgi:hypothetical protein
MGRESFQAAFGGAAGRARVGHLKVETGRAQLLRKQRGISFTSFKHKAVGQTVAENKNGFRRRGSEGLDRQNYAKDCDASFHN